MNNGSIMYGTGDVTIQGSILTSPSPGGGEGYFELDLV